MADGNTGYIKLYRKLRDHVYWKERRVFSDFEAWVDILMSVRWQDEPEEVVIRGRTLVCNYGESLKSLDTWARRWHWSKPKVKRFLDAAEKRNDIVTISETVSLRIKVLNYRQYQEVRNDNVTVCDTIPLHRIRSKEVKKEKEILSPQTGDTDFETFWAQYPARGVPARKTGKEAAKKAWVALQKKGDLSSMEFILRVLEFDKKSDQWQNSKYIPMASTWLNRQPWKDETAIPEPKPPIYFKPDPEEEERRLREIEEVRQDIATGKLAKLSDAIKGVL